MANKKPKRKSKKKSSRAVDAFKKKKNRKKGSQKKRASGAGIGRFIGGLLLFCVLVGGLLLAVVFHQLDRQVREAFDAKRWALPAHIYARPLELYAGRNIDAASLSAELRGLGYRKVDAVNRPGSYSGNENRLKIATRGFQFADGNEPAQELTVDFAPSIDGGTGIVALASSETGDIAIARLEPRPLGSVSETAHEDRDLLRLSEVPDALVDILLLTEDRSFYTHHGIALRAIARATVANLRAGSVVQGGSTITQQLVKNILLTPERSWSRKIKEALMSVALDWRYSKPEILEAYLNEVYLGQSGNRAIHGFGLASQFYFDRPLAELDLHEMALLVGMVRGPSYYSPRRHPERAFARRNRVLDRVEELAGLDAIEMDRYREKDLGVTEKTAGRSGHPAFREYVQRHLRAQYDAVALQADGLQVFTTLDPLIQNAAEKALANGLARIETDRELPADSLEGAVVVVRVDNGEVLAAVGGRKAGFDGFNRALDARRPIGSLIKPAVFLTALEQSNRYSLVTQLEDKPFVVEGPGDQIWEPGNYSGEPHGEVTLIETLSHSYNLASARLGLDIGLEQVVETLQQLGLDVADLPRYPSLLLGALDLAPIEVAQMYQTLANGGFLAPLKAVSSVVDGEGQSLRRTSSGLRQTIEAAPVYLVTEAMQEVMQRGTGKSIASRFDPLLGLAGKTGTTDEFRDSWFAGFSGNYVTVVWVGRDDNQSTGLSGATGALKIFGDVMDQFTLTAVSRVAPANVARHRIDTVSGLLADDNCDTTQRLPFINGSEPWRWAPCSRTVAFEEPRPTRQRSGDGVRGWLNRVLGGSSSRDRRETDDNREARKPEPVERTRRSGSNDMPRSLDDSNR